MSASSHPDLAIPKHRPDALRKADLRKEEAAYAADQRRLARERDKYRDRFTGRQVSVIAPSVSDRLELHHVIPRSAGGSDDADNLLTLGVLTHKRFTCHELDVDLECGSDTNGPIIIVERKTGKRYRSVPGKRAEPLAGTREKDA